MNWDSDSPRQSRSTLFESTLFSFHLLVGLCLGDVSVFLSVDFVSDDTKRDLLTQHFPQFLDPILDFLKRVFVRDVVHQHGAVRISERDMGDGEVETKGILSMSIESLPNCLIHG